MSELGLRPTVRQITETLRNPPPPPKPIRPNKQGSLDEKCAWMKARMAAREAAEILKAERS